MLFPSRFVRQLLQPHRRCSSIPLLGFVRASTTMSSTASSATVPSPALCSSASDGGITEYTKQYINGEWVTSSNGPQSLIDVFDSNTGEVFARAPRGSAEDTAQAVEAAAAAFDSWSRTPLQERAEHLQRVLEEYSKRQKDVARCLQRELGAPEQFALRVQSTVFNMHFLTTLSLADEDEFEWTEDMGDTLLVKEPIGVVGCITPWNWPLNQIACKIAPALLAGCTVVLKPSEITPINAIIVAEAIHAAGLPRGVFNMVMGTGPEVAQPLAELPKVDMVSFTGSTRVGRLLHAKGAATLKRVRSELGGKSATVVLDDATPAQIAAMAGHVITNTGQSCNALGRLIVPESRYEEAVAIAKKVFESVRVVDAGKGGGKVTDIGPLASQAQFDRVTGYIRKGIAEGARLVCGGPERPAGFDRGYFVQPTVLADVRNDMTVAQVCATPHVFVRVRVSALLVVAFCRLLDSTPDVVWLLAWLCSHTGTMYVYLLVPRT